MGEKIGYPFLIGILLCGVLVSTGVLTATAMVDETTPAQARRADLILIDGLKTFRALERPAVPFLHDKHTQAVAKQGRDCRACHEMAAAKLILKFKRLEDTDRRTVMDIYHDQCIACHKESSGPDTATGPVTCGECHLKKGATLPNRRPMALDKSLHYRHVKANDNKCEKCHHQFDAQTKKLFYAQGKEGACLYCHGARSEENRISNRAASHQACVVCHQELRSMHKNAGPVQCAGCHDPRHQALIEKLTDVPRMKRGQPSRVLIKTVASKDNRVPATNRMSPVPFDHQAHEGYNESCRVCHHASLTLCAACHGILGNDDGGQVSLVQAMHQRDAQASCVGCHRRQQAKPACAGCHSSIPQGKSLASQAACQTCHISTKAVNPAPAETTEIQTVAERLLASRRSVTEPMALDRIPDTVVIKSLVNYFEAVVMPHRRIVLKLTQALKGSQLAQYFHAEATTLCQGCHHNSPATDKPPQCASCHGRTSEGLNLMRPGLLAAYHQQCIKCHDQMGLEKPASRECTSCHAKRK